MDCGSTKLTELDLSKCESLEILWCENNQLQKLDISKCPNLKKLHCIYNNMKNTDDVIGDTSRLITFSFDPQNSNPDTTPMPTQTPTSTPTTVPTIVPTTVPTTIPTQTPTAVPTIVPTQTPTAEPTTVPTIQPTVQPTAEPTIPSTTEKKEQKISVDHKSLTLYVGKKATTLKVSNAKGDISYKSSDPNIAKVSRKGKVTPRSAGKITITITAAGDSSYKVATLKVK